MVIPFVFEDHKVCLIIQAQATTLQLSKSTWSWSCSFANGTQDLLSICIWIWIWFLSCLNVKLLWEKLNRPAVQRFLSLQKVKLPIDVCWPERVDVPDQICHQWETLRGLLSLLKTSPIARIAFLSCHSKGFLLSLHPPGNVISQRGWDEWPHKTQIILGWKAAIGKKEGTSHFMSRKKRCFLPPKIPVTVPKIQDHQVHCNGD